MTLQLVEIFQYWRNISWLFEENDHCENRMLVKIASALPLFAMGNFPRKNTNKSVPVERLKTCLWSCSFWYWKVIKRKIPEGFVAKQILGWHAKQKKTQSKCTKMNQRWTEIAQVLEKHIYLLTPQLRRNQTKIKSDSILNALWFLFGCASVFFRQASV